LLKALLRAYIRILVRLIDLGEKRRLLLGEKPAVVELENAGTLSDGMAISNPLALFADRQQWHRLP
jgi:hypothetical protein